MTAIATLCLIIFPKLHFLRKWVINSHANGSYSKMITPTLDESLSELLKFTSFNCFSYWAEELKIMVSIVSATLRTPYFMMIMINQTIIYVPFHNTIWIKIDRGKRKTYISSRIWANISWTLSRWLIYAFVWFWQV